MIRPSLIQAHLLKLVERIWDKTNLTVNIMLQIQEEVDEYKLYVEVIHEESCQAI